MHRLFLCFLLLTPSLLAQDDWKTSAAAGSKAYGSGKYVEAEAALQHALELAGDNKDQIARSLRSLSDLYRAQGRYAAAEPLLVRLVEVRTELLGPEHVDLAADLNDLASIYRTTGKSTEAIPLVDRAIQIHKKALGRDHIELSKDIALLAQLYIDKQEFPTAIQMYIISIRIAGK